MMYSKCQQFIATILLFSILLQSCGNPNCQMVAPVHASTSGKTNSPKHRASLTSVQNQGDDRECVTELEASRIDRPAEALIEATEVPAFASSRAAEDRDQSSTLSATAARSPVVSSRQLTQAVRPSSGSKRPSAHVIPKTPVSQHTSHREKQEGNTPPLTRRAQLSHSPQRVAHQPQTESKPTPRNIAAYPEASGTASRHAPTPFYPSAQGYQVCFQAEEGKWQAQVEDIWGREQRLPVVCARDQTPARAIEQLASKARGQHKYWVHLLETNQPPWAPRCVYVGALGLRGGGNTTSAQHSAYTTNHNHAEYFELNTTQISEDSELVKMSMAHMALNLMIPNDYGAFCNEAYTIFTLLKSPVNPGVLENNLRSLWAYIRHVPLITNAVPTYVSAFNWASAEVIGVVVVRFLLPTNRICDNLVTLCRGSCNTLLESIKRILAEKSISGNTSRAQAEECDVLHTEANREAHRQISERERVREQAEREQRMAEEEHQREEKRREAVARAEERRQSQSTHLHSASARRRARVMSNAAHRLSRIRRTQVSSEEANTAWHATAQAPVRPSSAATRETHSETDVPAARTQEDESTKPVYTDPDTIYTDAVSPSTDPLPGTSAQEEEDDNVEEVYTDYRAMPSDASASSANLSPNDAQEEDRKMPAAAAAAASSTREASSEADVPAARTQEDGSTKPVYTDPDTIYTDAISPSTDPLPATRAQEDEDDNVEEIYTDYGTVHADARPLAANLSPYDAQEEDRKMPAVAAATIPPTPDIAKKKREHIKAYLEKWQTARPSERCALQAQGQDMLEQVEALKKNIKGTYRKNITEVEVPKTAPLVWSQPLQRQHNTKAQLNELRSMRSQLIESLQPTEAALHKAGIPVACETSYEKVYYSSDEDTPPFLPRKVIAKHIFQVHDVKQMHASQKGVDAVASHEGFRAHTYTVGGRGNDTIGYGHEVLKGEDFSQGVTREQALDLLEKDVQKALKKVKNYVKVPLKQHQLDALVSYVYNTGSLWDTQLLEKLNARDFEGAASEMDIKTQQATGKVLPGLVRRRAIERKLFLYGYKD